MRDTIVARDATIRNLSRALEARIDRGPEPAVAAHEAAWTAVAADLKRRIDRCNSRSERIERRLAQGRAALAAECTERQMVERREAALRREIEAIEASLAVAEAAADTTGRVDATLLYIGGRPAQIGHLRAWAERCGARLLHHDGGIEERSGLLLGLVSGADAVLFPVDCISHAAISLVKRLCHHAGKPFVPLRSTGLAPFCAALRNPALRPLKD